MYKKFLCLLLSLLFSQQFNAESLTLELSQEEKIWIQENPTVFYGAEKDWAPFDFVDEQNEHAGLARDYLIEISKLTGLRFEPVVDDWVSLITGIRNNNLDLMPVIYSSPNRDDILRLTEPYDSVLEYFYIRDDLNVHDIQDLKGRTLAIPKAYATLNDITQQISNLNILEVDTLSDAIYAVIEKKADFLVDSQAVIDYFIKKNRITSIKAFKPQAYLTRSLHMGVAKDKRVLYEIINKAISAIPLQTKNAIGNKWFKNLNAVNLEGFGLSEIEKKWLYEHPVIRLGVESNWPPYEFINDEGQLQGLSADLLKLIEKKLGMQFTVISQYSWPETVAKAKNRELDMISSIVKLSDRENYLKFTQAYYSPPVAIFTRRDEVGLSSLSDLKNKSVAIENQYYTHVQLADKYPEINFHIVESTADALKALSYGEVDAYVGDQGAGNWISEQSTLNNLNLQPEIELGDAPLRLAVRDDWPILQDILNKALASVSDAEMASIRRKWLGASNSPIMALNLSQTEKRWLINHPVILLGVETNWPPYEFINESGQLQGLSAEIIQLVEQRLNLKFKIISEYNWSETLAKAKNREIDLISSIVKTPDRETYLNFTKDYYSPPIAIFTRNDNKGISNLNDLKNKTISIENEYYTHIEILNNYPDINLRVFDTTTEALKALSYGEVDAYVGDQGAGNWVAEVNALNNLSVSPEVKFGDAPLRVGVRNDWPVFQSILDKALDSISEAEMASIRRKWLGVGFKGNQDDVMTLRDSERLWLSQHKEIFFTGDPAWLPYEAFDNNGNYIGIVADVLSLIEKKLGIKITKIPTLNWEESLEKVKNGEINILSETTNSSLDSILDFTDPYLSSPIVIVMKSGTDYVTGIKKIKQMKIALVKGYGYVTEIVNKYPDLNIEYVETMEDGLLAVSVGRVDVLFANLAQASYKISELGMNNISIVGQTEFKTELAFGIQKKYAPLVPLFNRALASIEQNEKNLILDKWGKEKFSEKTDYSFVAKLMGILLGLTVFVAYWNWRLSREVRLRKDLENQTQALIDSIPLQIMVAKKTGEFLSVNPKALSDYKINKNELSKYNLSDLYNDPKERLEVRKEVIEKGKVNGRIVSFNNPDGSIRSMMISVIPVIYNKQNAYLTSGLDMTERLLMESELLFAKKNADLANLAKSQFLANMSHEIRTPMNSIIGFTELLNEQVKDTKLRSFVKTIQSAGHNLLRLINDILDLSKIEAGKFNLELRPCDPRALIGDVVNMFTLEARKNNIDLIVSLDEQIPQNLLTDPTRSRQILFNLLGNAVKFTKEGFIKVSAQAINTNLSKNKTDLLISVEDTGIGISKNQQKKIFEQFTQSEGQRVEQYGGTGLGLAIVKRLVEKMGGTIRLRSELGKGSTFIILFNDLSICTSADIEIEKSNIDYTILKFKPATVLVVDDIKDNRDLIVANFASTALHVLVAKNGQEAVDIVEKNTVDLILMDIRMPVMDGYEAANLIKQSLNVPIVALTASVMTDQFEQNKTNDFDGYLRKPILKSEIFKELSRFLSYEVVQELEPQSQEIQLSDKEFSELPKTIEKLIEVSIQFKGIEKNTNIESIKEFSKAIEKISENSSLLILKDYQDILQHNIDIFDIAAIKRSLQSFTGLVEELKAVH